MTNARTVTRQREMTGQREIKRRPGRHAGWTLALVAATWMFAGCGSDGTPQPLETTPASVIDGHQGAPGGAHNPGNSADTVEISPTSSTATADTQEPIGNQSSGGDRNGLPKGTTP